VGKGAVWCNFFTSLLGDGPRFPRSGSISVRGVGGKKEKTNTEREGWSQSHRTAEDPFFFLPWGGGPADSASEEKERGDHGKERRVPGAWRTVRDLGGGGRGKGDRCLRIYNFSSVVTGSGETRGRKKKRSRAPPPIAEAETYLRRCHRGRRRKGKGGKGRKKGRAPHHLVVSRKERREGEGEWQDDLKHSLNPPPEGKRGFEGKKGEKKLPFSN